MGYLHLKEFQHQIQIVRWDNKNVANSGDATGFEANVVVVEPTGSETQVFVRLGQQEIVGVFRERHEFLPGQKVRLRPRGAQAHLFDPASGQRI